MKIKSLILSLSVWMYAIVVANAQEYTGTSPSFLGGEQAKKEFIFSNFNPPHKNIEGTVKLKFIVEADGELANFELIENSGKGVGEELLRVYKMMPAWIPGGLEGVAQRIPVTETMKFKPRNAYNPVQNLSKKELRRISIKGQ